LAIGAVAAEVSLLRTTLVGFAARRVGWVVEPTGAVVHKVTTPDFAAAPTVRGRGHRQHP